MVRSASGHTCTAETRDLSLGGGCLALDDNFELAPEGEIDVVVTHAERERSLPARVVACDGKRLRVAWRSLSLREEAEVVDLLFGRPDAWLDWDRDRPPDRPLSSLRTLVHESGQGLRRVVASERRIVSGAGAGIAVAAACFLLIHTGWRVAPIVDRFSALGSQIAGALASVTEGR